MNDDLTPRNVIARAIATKAENDPESFGYYMGETDGVLAALDAAGWSITRQPDPAIAFLRRCATCQVQNGIVPPHAECYRIADGHTDCCCGEVVPDVE